MNFGYFSRRPEAFSPLPVPEARLHRLEVPFGGDIPCIFGGASTSHMVSPTQLRQLLGGALVLLLGILVINPSWLTN